MNKQIPQELIYENIKARFNPGRTDDLRTEALALIGKILIWSYSGTNDENCKYPNQRTYSPIGMATGWMPECNLDFIAVEARADVEK